MENFDKEALVEKDLYAGKVTLYVDDIGFDKEYEQMLIGKGIVRLSEIPTELVDDRARAKVASVVSALNAAATDLHNDGEVRDYQDPHMAIGAVREGLGKKDSNFGSATIEHIEKVEAIKGIVQRHYTELFMKRVKYHENNGGIDDELRAEEYFVIGGLLGKRFKQLEELEQSVKAKQ